ncbi:mitochondrial amidoxime-reducing component 1-like [Mizuhopecten yessoensis]|uniref:MOSC domain-containing protein 1, mitochondrial n=1 Tax=Mizuhopecten yessoensis TaxID=6573 RepID=A0A210PMU7_MIZYE|nr:mitochondrial amidoxime-reducing component 1-like [Mizuhopecten yessoensis]OWF37746.1 MOSC domain-containing protein 1, mitochondrial [Mizuhopecten yessoensis]
MSDRPNAVALAATLAGVAVFKYTCLVWMSNKYRTRPFEKVGTISELYVFPTKSLGGLRVDSADCTPTGLTFQGVTDRHWAVAASTGVYVTQRQIPKMALISTSLQGDTMLLDAPGMSSLIIPIHPKQGPKTWVSKIKIKEEWSTSLDLGDEAASWMDKFLGKTGLRVHFSSPEMDKRDASNVTKLWKHNAKKGDTLAFSDYCGYMLMTSASLNELNKRLAEPVTMLNFRANIVVDECPAFDEDDWDEVKIGKATFRNIDACTRCILVTVDPFKGEKSKDEEPLTTLKKFRLKPPYGPKPCLGIHLAMDHNDTIHTGDVVYARRKRN